MVQAENRALGVAVVGSVVAHLAVLLVAALNIAFPIFAVVPVEDEVFEEEPAEVLTILLPDLSPPAPQLVPDEEGLIPVPEVPLPDPEENPERPQNYIRTTQNAPESAAPESADFISDRNTKAASERPASPDGTDPVPTMEGERDLPGIELKVRDHRDGEIKDDEAQPTPESASAPPVPPSNPLAAEPAPPEEPATLGERNEATDPDALGPEVDTPPVIPGDGSAKENPLEAEVPSVSLEPLEELSDPSEVPPQENPLEAKTAPEPIEASIPPPANFENILGGEDTFPLPKLTDDPPTPDAFELVEPAVTPPVPPLEEAVPLPEIRRPEVIMPAEPVLPLAPSNPSAPSVPLPGDPKTETADAFQPHTRKRAMSGTISNRGPAAVDAEATPIGRYTRLVTADIERRWHRLRSSKADFVTFGNMRIRFDVTPEGRTTNIRILSNDANPVMTDFTLSAIMGAKVDPMPKEVRDDLDLADGLLEITYNVIIY